jgi:hypothetical protein
MFFKKCDVRHVVLVLSATTLLSACGIGDLVGAIPSISDLNTTPEVRYLEGIVDHLAVHDFAFVEAQLDERLLHPAKQADETGVIYSMPTDEVSAQGREREKLRSGIAQAASFLPSERPTRIEAIGWNVFAFKSLTKKNADARTVTVVLEYTYPTNRWAVVSAQLTGQADNLRVASLRVSLNPAPLAQVNAFKIQNQDALHYLFLVAPALSMGLCVFAFVQCLRTKHLKRKWLWALFTLVGICAFQLDWATGDVSVNLFRINLLAAGFVRQGLVGPWTVIFCIPVGAAIFLWKHSQAPAVVEPSHGSPVVSESD